MLVPSILAVVRPGNSQASLPLGPSTFTCCPFSSTFTLAGTAMGCFPMRDIIVFVIQRASPCPGSPNITKQFATEIILAGLRTAHDALGSGHNGGAQPAADPGNFRRPHIIAQSRGTDAAEAF